MGWEWGEGAVKAIKYPVTFFSQDFLKHFTLQKTLRKVFLEGGGHPFWDFGFVEGKK